MNSSRRPDPARRALCAGVLGTSLTAIPLSRVIAQTEPIKIGTTPVFLDDQLGFLDTWRQYLENVLGAPVSFVQRGNYREITDLLLAGQLDCAWLCGYPYVRYRDRLRLVATPLFHGRPLYESYLIVSANDLDTRDLTGMKGRTFAYSDSLSNSGYLTPRHTLWTSGIDPDRHFSRSFFTWAHKKVVQAVAVGMAEGGAVDGYVWETLNLIAPEITRNTRVAWKSPSHGFPPVVALASAPATARLRDALSGMASSPKGQALLKKLNLDGFANPDDRTFDSIAQMMRDLTSAGKVI